MERAVLSGRVSSGTPNRPQLGCTPQPISSGPWRETLSSLTAWLEQGMLRHAVQMSAPNTTGALRCAGRVELRWRVSFGLRIWWHALEAADRRAAAMRTTT